MEICGSHVRIHIYDDVSCLNRDDVNGHLDDAIHFNKAVIQCKVANEGCQGNQNVNQMVDIMQDTVAKMMRDAVAKMIHDAVAKMIHDAVAKMQDAVAKMVRYGVARKV